MRQRIVLLIVVIMIPIVAGWLWYMRNTWQRLQTSTSTPTSFENSIQEQWHQLSNNLSNLWPPQPTTVPEKDIETFQKKIQEKLQAQTRVP